MDHEIVVNQSGDAFYARCTCGWESDTEMSEDHAENAGSGHQVEMARTPPSQSELDGRIEDLAKASAHLTQARERAKRANDEVEDAEVEFQASSERLDATIGRMVGAIKGRLESGE